MIDFLNNNPTKQENSDAFGELYITRLSPGNNTLQADFFSGNRFSTIQAEVVSAAEDELHKKEVSAESGNVIFSGLSNNIDYIIKLTAYENGTITAKAPVRLFRCGQTPGVVVNYIHPEDYTYMPSGRSTASPSLLRLPGGRLIASHDIFWGQCAQNMSLVFYSDDNGENWSFLSQVFPCFWGKLFMHKNNVYMLGMSYEYGKLQIFKSEDGGRSWSEPAQILPEGNNVEGGPHKAPMPVISYKGRLWTCIDYGCWKMGGHANGFISIDENDDLMDGDKWVCTGFLKYNPDWPGTCRGKSGGCLEGNAVVSPEGRLFNLLRYETKSCTPNYGKAILLEADPSKPDEMPRLYSVVEFPGNLSKFKVDYDPVTRKYYALVSRVTTDFLSQRNILSLSSSEDLTKWRIERDILNYMDNGWYEGVDKVGFQYVDWLFDGNDIIVLSRTAINGAYNYHNANYITFHRIINFRK